jgi:hypothetical protein
MRDCRLSSDDDPGACAGSVGRAIWPAKGRQSAILFFCGPASDEDLAR